ncbi:MAG: hypothetical protein UU76_C0007G0010 [Parcubacteria group bacterium GW2011_GWC1_41_7]|nr:MAG: hypothetical protein UU76_C0007G0010 [Parcubacteria group bacterium GW2011_GWC1_41_7]
MIISPKAAAKAGAYTAGIAYIFCALVVLMAPQVAMTLTEWLMHIVNVDVLLQNIQMTTIGFIAGLVQVMIYTYVAFWIFAVIYNKGTK